MYTLNEVHAVYTIFTELVAFVQDINSRTEEPRKDVALETASIVGSILSMVGLLLTIITMTIFRYRGVTAVHVLCGPIVQECMR